jgi:hypothetical protein
MNHSLFLLAVVASTAAFSPCPYYPLPLTTTTTRQLPPALFGCDNPEPETTDDASSSSSSSKNTTTIVTPQWGVSYIGGDPCGSKYNDDPFDVQVQKPGMPDDMKARIQALVDAQKDKEQSE